MKNSEWIISTVFVVILLAAFVFIVYPTITARTPITSDATNIRYTIGEDMSIVAVTFDVPSEATAAFVIYDEHSVQCAIEAAHATCPIDFPVVGGKFEYHIVK